MCKLIVKDLLEVAWRKYGDTVFCYDITAKYPKLQSFLRFDYEPN